MSESGNPCGGEAKSSVDNQRPRRIYQNSLGNKVLHQTSNSNKKRKLSSEHIDVTDYLKLTDLDIFNNIQSQSNCCQPSISSDIRSVLEHFTVNGQVQFTEAVSFYRKCREKVIYKSKEEKEQFLLEQIRRCKVGEVFLQRKKERKYKFKYEIDGYQLCRHSFCYLYDISVRQFEACIAAMKSTGVDHLKTYNIRPFKDSTLHKFNYNETEALFKDNLDDGKFVGKVLLSLSLYSVLCL